MSKCKKAMTNCYLRKLEVLKGTADVSVNFSYDRAVGEVVIHLEESPKDLLLPVDMETDELMELLHDLIDADGDEELAEIWERHND